MYIKYGVWFAKTRESHLSILHFTTLFVHIFICVFDALHFVTPLDYTLFYGFLQTTL